MQQQCCRSNVTTVNYRVMHIVSLYFTKSCQTAECHSYQDHHVNADSQVMAPQMVILNFTFEENGHPGCIYMLLPQDGIKDTWKMFIAAV